MDRQRAGCLCGGRRIIRQRSAAGALLFIALAQGGATAHSTALYEARQRHGEHEGDERGIGGMARKRRAAWGGDAGRSEAPCYEETASRAAVATVVGM